MNKKSRCLPGMQQVFMRKQYYQAHLRKMSSLKSSLHSLKTQVSPSKESLPRMKVIRQVVVRPNAVPNFLRRRMHQHQIQNQRMKLRIKRSISTIRNADLQQHSRRTEQIKSRITKFKTDVCSSRVLLKCEASLISINKYKESLHRLDYNRSLNDKLKSYHQITNPFEGKCRDKSMKQELNRLDGFERIFLKRNQEKVRGYFQCSNNLTPVNKRSRPETMQQAKKNFKTQPSKIISMGKSSFTADVQEKIKKVQEKLKQLTPLYSKKKRSVPCE